MTVSSAENGHPADLSASRRAKLSPLRSRTVASVASVSLPTKAGESSVNTAIKPIKISLRQDKARTGEYRGEPASLPAIKLRLNTPDSTVAKKSFVRQQSRTPETASPSQPKRVRLKPPENAGQVLVSASQQTSAAGFIKLTFGSRAASEESKSKDKENTIPNKIRISVRKPEADVADGKARKRKRPPNKGEGDPAPGKEGDEKRTRRPKRERKPRSSVDPSKAKRERRPRSERRSSRKKALDADHSSGTVSLLPVDQYKLTAQELEYSERIKALVGDGIKSEIELLTRIGIHTPFESATDAITRLFPYHLLANVDRIVPSLEFALSNVPSLATTYAAAEAGLLKCKERLGEVVRKQKDRRASAEMVLLDQKLSLAEETALYERMKKDFEAKYGMAYVSDVQDPAQPLLAMALARKKAHVSPGDNPDLSRPATPTSTLRGKSTQKTVSSSQVPTSAALSTPMPARPAPPSAAPTPASGHQRILPKPT